MGNARICLCSERGFTLLELLLSIALLSVVLVTIYGTLSMGSNAWEKGEKAVEKIQRKRVVMDIIAREIKSTFPYVVTPTELDTHKKFYAFEGKKESISFVSTVPLRGGKKGLSWLSFWVEEDEGLVVVERDALRTDIFKEKEFFDRDERKVLDAYVDKIRFEYFEMKSGTEEGEGEGEWKETWDAEKEGKLPHAVSVKLTFRSEDEEEETYTREITVQLKIHNEKMRVVR